MVLPVWGEPRGWLLRPMMRFALQLRERQQSSTQATETNEGREPSLNVFTWQRIKGQAIPRPSPERSLSLAGMVKSINPDEWGYSSAGRAHRSQR